LLKVYTGLSIGRPIFILTAAKAVIAYASLLLPSFNEAIREKTKIDIHITKVHGEDINRVVHAMRIDVSDSRSCVFSIG
jgi:hypothetical protein